MNTKELFNLPNLLSLSRIVFGIVFLGIFIVIQSGHNYLERNLILQIIAFVIFIIAIITDALDGYYARKFNIVTDIGKHLDPLTDSLFFVIVFLTFTITGLMYPPFFVLILLREFSMHLILRPYVKRQGKSLPASIYGKLKTVFQCIFSLIILFMLIVTQIADIIGKEGLNKNLVGLTHSTAFIFFAIIVFLSLMSMTIYLINLKKVLSNPVK